MCALDIRVAKSAGFCFGVRDAIQIALDTAETSPEQTYMLGHIVHNEHVVDKVEKSGIQLANDVSEIPEGSTLLVRAHGAVPQVFEKAEERGLSLVNATCPLVHEIHEVALQLESEGYRVVVIGDHGHDEVNGICGHVKDPVIISNPDEVETAFPRKASKLGIVCQSTQNIENVQQVIAELITRCREMKFIDTICRPTYQHQEEIHSMPSEVDVMIIVGSFTSANTCRLTEISRKMNARTYQVESAADIRDEWFEGVSSVGVHAGASTPDELIKEVISTLHKTSADD